MTVAELIAKLQELPGDSLIVVGAYDHDESFFERPAVRVGTVARGRSYDDRWYWASEGEPNAESAVIIE